MLPISALVLFISSQKKPLQMSALTDVLKVVAALVIYDMVLKPMLTRRPAGA